MWKHKTDCFKNRLVDPQSHVKTPMANKGTKSNLPKKKPRMRPKENSQTDPGGRSAGSPNMFSTDSRWSAAYGARQFGIQFQPQNSLSLQTGLVLLWHIHWEWQGFKAFCILQQSSSWEFNNYSPSMPQHAQAVLKDSNQCMVHVDC